MAFLLSDFDSYYWALEMEIDILAIGLLWRHEMFSVKHRTFEEWLAANPKSTTYRQRIVELHRKHPKATLSQLRGHARQNEQRLSQGASSDGTGGDR